MATQFEGDLHITGGLALNGQPMSAGGSANMAQTILGTPDHHITRGPTAVPNYEYHVSGSGNQVVLMDGYNGEIDTHQEVDLVLYPELWDNNSVFAVGFKVVGPNIGSGQDFLVRMRIECSPTFEYYTSRVSGWVPSYQAGASRYGIGMIKHYINSSFQNYGIKSSNGTVAFTYSSNHLAGYSLYTTVGPSSW